MYDTEDLKETSTDSRFQRERGNREIQAAKICVFLRVFLHALCYIVSITTWSMGEFFGGFLASYKTHHGSEIIT